MQARNWVTPEQIAQARQMDLYTYLGRYEPGELVHVRGDVYSTRTHDSLKISSRTGKWFRWSTGDGGHTALDYLTKVRGMNFQEAVRLLTGAGREPVPARDPPKAKAQKPRGFVLPEPHTDNRCVIAYLTVRGINPRLISYCISKGFLYEDTRHNCVFVGMDGGVPRNAMLRSTNSDSTFLREWDGSNKRFTFGIQTDNDAKAVYLFESCIDLLSYLSLAAMRNENVRGANFLSLNGIYFSRDDPEQSKPPQALEQYLREHPGTKELRLCLDNDFAGHKCVQLLQSLYSSCYAVILDLPKEKDYNAQLMTIKGITRQVKTRGENAYER